MTSTGYDRVEAWDDAVAWDRANRARGDPSYRTAVRAELARRWPDRTASETETRQVEDELRGLVIQAEAASEHWRHPEPVPDACITTLTVTMLVPGREAGLEATTAVLATTLPYPGIIRPHNTAGADIRGRCSGCTSRCPFQSDCITLRQASRTTSDQAAADAQLSRIESSACDG